MTSLLLLLLLPPLLSLFHPTPLAQGQQQISVTDYVYGFCNTQNYERNGTFARNLNTAVSILTQSAATGARYHLAQVKEGSDNTSWAYGMFQCRGDVSSQDCSDCLGAILTASYCGATYGTRIQLLGCFYRYENYDFTAGTLEITLVTQNCSSQQNASSLYQANLATAINSTASTAPNNSDYYAAATVGSAHALSQCLGYLSSLDCASCLSQSSSRVSICNTSSSGYFYYVSCYYLFSDTDLLFPNTSSTSPTGSPPLPPPAPPRSAISPTGLINITSSSGSTSSSSLTAAAIAGISVGSAFAIAVLVVFCAMCVIVKRRRSIQSGDGIAGSKRFKFPSKIPSDFTVDELQTATESFHSRNKLGQGGFGVVYKGTLRNGTEVAIKIISTGESRVKGVDFSNELNLITTVQHRNLIQLLGCAKDDYRWYLVYEYLPNRSLDLHLFGNNDEAHQLDWKTRFNIICGIAKGLCYLHVDSHVHIVHRDIKASNILLDANLEPKIGDFGLARLFSDDVSHLTTAVAGTLGYMAPEYALGGQLSEKVDVYSFGLVMLEILSGKRVIENNVDGGQKHILQWAWDKYERQQVLEMVDGKIEGTANEWEVTRAVHVALLCTQAKPHSRPTMPEVYMMLRTESAILELPSRPGIMSMGIFSMSRNEQSDSYNDSSDAAGLPAANDGERRNWASPKSATTDMSVTTGSSGVTEQGAGAERRRRRRYSGLWWMSSSGITDTATETTESGTEGPITELQAR